jgi:hypothetical protein
MHQIFGGMLIILLLLKSSEPIYKVLALIPDASAKIILGSKRRT